MTIEDVLAMNEMQIFDRKSIHVKPVDLSDTICAFANADGGIIAIGISDKHRRIEGVDYYPKLLNDILRTPVDFCRPTVPATTEMVQCTNSEGKPDHVLLMHIDASPMLHANSADEVYLRIGDKSRKLDFNDRLTLMYAKGLRYFEDEPVYGASMDDIDIPFVRGYIAKIGYSKSAEEYLRENKKFVTIKDGKEQISTAAILLFGKKPQDFFPRAFIRFIRYDGIEEKVGKDMNVIKDVIFEGRILDQVSRAVDYIKTQMKEKTYLGHDGIFITEAEYSEFVRTEIVVNAAAHRDYGIKGTDIQIKMFDDRLEVDSPGTFAGMVKRENIRYTHFSRNPKIAAFLKDYGYVKEYGEGVDRMCRELEAIGLPDPKFNNHTFILKTTVMSASYDHNSMDHTSIQPEIMADSPEKWPIQDQKAANSPEKRPIGTQKVADSLEKLPIQNQKAADSPEKLPIQNQTSADLDETAAIPVSKRPIKISQTFFNRAYENKGYNQPTINNLNRIYELIDSNQIFTASYIAKILECSDRTARNLITKMKDMDVLRPVSGKGKGIYRFRYDQEQ